MLSKNKTCNSTSELLIPTSIIQQPIFFFYVLMLSTHMCTIIYNLYRKPAITVTVNTFHDSVCAVGILVLLIN